MLLLLLGHLIEVDTSRLDAAASSRLEHVWQDCLVDGDLTAAENVVRLLPSSEAMAAGEQDLVLGEVGLDHTYTVSQHLTSYAIRCAAGELLMLHAAGLVPGREAQGVGDHAPLPVVGVIASSGTGKTTFCRRLSGESSYVTDETLAIRPEDLSVIAYPKPLSVVNEEPEKAAGLARHKADHAPADLGLSSVSPDASAALAALVIGERVSEGNELHPLRLTEALELAIAQSSSLYALEQPLRLLAELLTRAGGPWILRFSDQAKCGQILADLAEQTEIRPVAWKHFPGPQPLTGGVSGSSGVLDVYSRPALAADELLWRAPWDDAVESEGGVVLLFGRTPVTLGGPGAAVWLVLDGQMSLAQVHERVLAVMGEHPESWDLVAQAAHELVTQGVLKVQIRP